MTTKVPARQNRPVSGPADRASHSWRNRCAALAMACAACYAGPAAATMISFDTTALAGTSARLDFSLLDGDGALGNNTVTIASLGTDGSFGAFDCTVSCSGGPPFAITDAGGLGQFLQDLTLGHFLSFDLSFTTNFSGSGAPDRLSLLLLDPGTNFTLVDTNLDFPNDAVPVQDALLLVDQAPGTRIQVASATNPQISGTVPEPGTVGLIGLGFALLMGHGMRRQRYRA